MERITTTKVEEISQLKWEKRGKLSDGKGRFEVTSDRGVYLFIFQGKPKRIIYVGDTPSNTFSVRWDEHYKLFLKGGRYIGRVNTYEDFYSLISYKGNNNSFYFKYLSIEGKFWNPNIIPKGQEYYQHVNHKDMNQMRDYEKDWKNFVMNEYLPNIEIWTCSLYEKEIMHALETQIQTAFGSCFNLSFYKGSSQNWLGSQSQGKGVARKYCFHFEKYPDLDLISKGILANLYFYLET